MAYWIQEPRTTQNNPKYRSYMCDFRTDIDKLPKQGVLLSANFLLYVRFT